MKKRMKVAPKKMIISHSYADFDAIASTIAVSKIDPDAIPVIHISVENEVQRFLSIYKDFLQIQYWQDIDLHHLEKVYYVDFQGKDRLTKELEANGKQLHYEIYDHHPYEGFFPKKQCHIKPYGSTMAILYEKLKKLKIPFNPIEATLFLIGIYEDTGALTFSSTTVKDMEAAAYFLKHGAKLNIISEFVFPAIDENQKELFSELFNAIQVIDIKGISIAITYVAHDKYVNGVSFLAHRIMDTMDVDALFVLVRFKEKTILIGRSKDERLLHIGKMMEMMGGGGHPQAGSAFIENDKLDLNARSMLLLRQIKKNLQTSRLVKDYMASPVKVVAPDTSAEETLKIMLRYGHSGLPVMKNDRLFGIISRSDIGRINEEYLIKRPVSAYMSKNPVMIRPEASMKEAEKLMVEHDIGRLPVISEGKLVGILTRSDILRALFGMIPKAFESKQSTISIPSRKQISADLQACIDPSVLDKIHLLGEIAQENKYRVFLVGGCVRDFLLNIKPRDFDFLVEGDAISFAESIADRNSGTKLTLNPQFRTAKIKFQEGFTFDLASARTEYYEHPADLPTVSSGSLREDLFRRDFSINTLAMNILPNQFGHIVDYYKGYQDLKKKKIRILHNLSFIEDPSRIFRAVSYCLKLGFSLEHKTKEAAINAMNSGIFTRTSKFRILNEWLAMLKEPIDQGKTMKMLQSLKAIPMISDNIIVTSGMVRVLKRSQQLSPLLEPFQESWITYLLIIFEKLNPDELDEILERLKLNRRMKTSLLHIRQLMKTDYKMLAKTTQPDIIFRLLEHLDKTEWLYLMAKSTGATFQKVYHFVECDQYIKLLANGHLLKEWTHLSDKLLGILIQKLLAKKIILKWVDLETEKKYALEMAKEIQHEENKH
jgi:tRNA nucleotidyltransferase (CCA-adding enzyme)